MLCVFRRAGLGPLHDIAIKTSVQPYSSLLPLPWIENRSRNLSRCIPNAIRAQAGKLVVAIVRRDELCRRFMRIPGVGPSSALAFKTVVDDPRRFRHSRTVGAYFGLMTRRSQSGHLASSIPSRHSYRRSPPVADSFLQSRVNFVKSAFHSPLSHPRVIVPLATQICEPVEYIRLA